MKKINKVLSRIGMIATVIGVSQCWASGDDVLNLFNNLSKEQKIAFLTLHVNELGFQPNNSVPNQSILNKKIIKVDGVYTQDWKGAYTLQDYETGVLSGNDVVESAGQGDFFDAPEVDTYDPAARYFGTQVVFAADVPLSVKGRSALKQLLGLDIPDNQKFQIIIEKSSALNATFARDDPNAVSNGGIESGQQLPISLKAQYPYTKYAPSPWYDQTIDGVPSVKGFCIDGTVTVNSALIEEDGSSLTYPERKAQLSVHTVEVPDGFGGVRRYTSLSPDVLHLYRDGSAKPATLDTDAIYSPEAYNRLIKSEDKTKVLLYKIQYNDWKRAVWNGGGKNVSTPLQQEADRWGMILMLSDDDYVAFQSVVINDSAFGNLLNIDFFKNSIKGVKLADIFN